MYPDDFSDVEAERWGFNKMYTKEKLSVEVI